MEFDRAEIEKLRREWAGRRWDRERGIESFEDNNRVVFVRASVEEVGRALAPDAVAWEREALGREIALRRCGCFVFRLRGHEWAGVVDSTGSPIDRALGPDWERTLSERLETRVIDYAVSDTCIWIGYSLWEDGELLEEFSATELSTEEEADAGRPDPEQSAFSSKRRGTTLADIRNVWDFTRDFFVEQDAYDPGIDFRYFLGHREPRPGLEVEVQNPGFVMMVTWGEEVTSTPEIERVDYMAFGPPKRAER